MSQSQTRLSIDPKQYSSRDFPKIKGNKKGSSGIFLTQEKDNGGEEKVQKTPRAHTPGVRDPKIRGMLNKLHKTIDKLNVVSSQCQSSINRSLTTVDLTKLRTTMDTFNLTKIDLQPKTAKNSMLRDNFLSMRYVMEEGGEYETAFFSHNNNDTVSKLVDDIDFHPKTKLVLDPLWSDVNLGMNSFNEVKHEADKKQKHLIQLREELVRLKKYSQNDHLKQERQSLIKAFKKSLEDFQMTQWQHDSLNHMLQTHRWDVLIHKNRFSKIHQKMPSTNHQLQQKIDDILTQNKVLEAQANEYVEIRRKFFYQKNEKERLKKTADTFFLKTEVLDKKIDAERAYISKKKEFIVRNKKEIEKEKNRATEDYKGLLKSQLKDAKRAHGQLRREFDELASISRGFDEKQDYIRYFENLSYNNEKLENEVLELTNELKQQRIQQINPQKESLRMKRFGNDRAHDGIDEEFSLKNQLEDLEKKTFFIEHDFEKVQNLYQGTSSGILSIFHKIIGYKNEIGLDKLDKINLSRNNMNDILNFCGEVLETIQQNQPEDQDEIHSQPLSLGSLDGDDF